MRKSNKLLVLCMLVLVLSLFPNQASLSASLQEDVEIPDFLEEPRPETQAVIDDVFNTKYSSPGLAVLTVWNMTQSMRSVTGCHLLFVNNQGKIVKELFDESPGHNYFDPQMFNETTLMVQYTPAGYLTFLNLETNTQYTIEAINGTLWGHHDVSYNPVTDTFMTLGYDNIEAEGANWTVDTIWEFDWTGKLVWEWSMADWVSNYTANQCQISNHSGPGGVLDYSHANTIYWDSSTNIIYINPRHLDNAWAIEYPTGKVLWIAGRNGDFTMYDKHGVQKDSLWYHSHSFYPVSSEPNKFILFDNDDHNQTNPDNKLSRLVEVVIDTETWIMKETWSWTAPPDYHSPVWSYARRLPNGNRFSCFGSRTFREGFFPPYPEGGSALIETNDTGVVWQLTLSPGYGIYRGRRFVPSLSLNSPTDLTCDQGINDCPCIIWTGKSVFKDYYQITKGGEVLVKDTWTSAKIFYELPSDLELGTHEYTITIFDLAGQSISDTVKVTVKTPTTVFEILGPVGVPGVPGVLVVGLTTVGLIVILSKRKMSRT